MHGGDIPIGTLGSIEKGTRTGTREGVAPMTTYRVHVTREDNQWLADVPELEGTQTYASSLTALDRHVREAIVLGADLPDEAMTGLDLSWTYDIGNHLVDQANEIRAEREALAAKEKRLDQVTRELAIKLTNDLGFSVRDAGPLLGISHQRISQLTPPTERKSAAAGGPRRSDAR
jgi:predicted RNase H-like HicB family nuclease